MTTTQTEVNGRARKSLAHQLDRLDSILDGLAEALNGAVADAVKEAVGAAVREAVQAVLHEVLTNPELAARLSDSQAAAAPPVAQAPTAPPGGRLRALLARTARAGKTVLVTAAEAGRRLWSLARLAAGAGPALAGLARAAWAKRRRAAWLAGVGGLVGLGCYLAGPLASSAVSALAGSALAAKARLPWPIRVMPWGRRTAAGECAWPAAR
jgi:hypothetical protein